MAYEVVISNSKLNSYGTRVLTKGLDIRQFERNPILLWMHNRPFRGVTDEVLPLGTVQNLRVEGDQLLGALVFDDKDEFAQRIKQKWDAGILKMVSPGIDIVEQSNDPMLLLPGQTRMTVSRSILREVSVVDIGSNDDALALYYEGKRLNLAAGESGDILKPIKTHLNMKAIALKLGLPETATENEILAAIGSVQATAARATAVEGEMATLKRSHIVGIVDQAVKARKITADKREHFVKLGVDSGVEALNTTLELIAPAQKPSDFVGGRPGQAAAEYKKLSEVPAEKRIELRNSEPDTYAALYKAEYGIEPVY